MSTLESYIQVCSRSRSWLTTWSRLTVQAAVHIRPCNPESDGLEVALIHWLTHHFHLLEETRSSATSNSFRSLGTVVTLVLHNFSTCEPSAMSCPGWPSFISLQSQDHLCEHISVQSWWDAHLCCRGMKLCPKLAPDWWRFQILAASVGFWLRNWGLKKHHQSHQWCFPRDKGTGFYLAESMAWACTCVTWCKIRVNRGWGEVWGFSLLTVLPGQ